VGCVRERWVSFDCYGTLVDWNTGISTELARLFGAADAPRLLVRYHELEPELEADGTRSYRQVLTDALALIAAEEELALATGEEDALARSLPTWPPFAEVPVALQELRADGWKLAILSNSDPDLIGASQHALGIEADLTVVAGEIGSFKPAPAHWRVFFERSGADPARHVHVAASLFHDIAPCRELGLPSVWINRLAERPDPEPTRELPDLAGLAPTLEELVPA
jgi:2-haloacid dehalogenase